MALIPISIRLLHTQNTLDKIMNVLDGYFGFGTKLSEDIIQELLNNGLVFREINKIEVGKDNMPRNQFEENEPSLNMSEEDKEFLGDRLYVPLPHLQDGHRYSIADLPSGDKAVVIEQGDTEDEAVKRMHTHDSFGRRYAGGNENG